MQKEQGAARHVQSVRDRIQALKLTETIDPKAAPKVTADLARELGVAVKDYVDAGGETVTDGEMPMILQRTSAARDAASASSGDVPVEPADAVAETPMATVDAQTRRAQQAYGRAAGVPESREPSAPQLENMETVALVDRGVFEQIRPALGEIRKAREDIRAGWARRRKPDEDD